MDNKDDVDMFKDDMEIEYNSEDDDLNQAFEKMKIKEN